MLKNIHNRIVIPGSAVAYTRPRWQSVAAALKEKGFSDEQVPSIAIWQKFFAGRDIVSRNALKSKAFEKNQRDRCNFWQYQKIMNQRKHRNAERLSMDCKAAAKIGNFSGGGKTRGE
ncbi:MAG: hypothetical protein R2941_15495 [Desulfobacterales bacterium]